MRITYSGQYSPYHLVHIGVIVQETIGSGGMIRRAGGIGVTGTVLVIVPLAAFVRGAPATVLTWIPLGAIALGLVALNEWGFRRAMAQGPLANQSVSGSVDQEGWQILTPHASSSIRWSGFTSFVYRPNYLLLVDRFNNVFAFAREFFAAPAEYEQVVTLARTYVAPLRRKLLIWNRLFRVIVWIVVIVTTFLLWSLFRTGA